MSLLPIRVAKAEDRMGKKVKVNDKATPIDNFVESILDSTHAGAVSTRHGIGGDWKKVDVQIEKSNRKSLL